MTREEVGHFLLTLYRGSQEQSIESFRLWALEQLLHVILFDWACWHQGTMNDEVCWLHTTFPYRTSPGKVRSLIPVMNPSQAAMARRPERHLSIMRTIPFDADQHNRLDEDGAPGETAGGEKPSLPYVTICLYWDDSTSLGEEQRRDGEIIGPHLIEAWIIKLFLHLHNNTSPFKSGYERALCDRNGTLWCASPHLLAMLREEWTQWRGHTLPAQLIKVIDNFDNIPIFDGDHVRCMISTGPTDDLVYIHVQRLPPLMVLPPRQRKIALELAQGKTYNQIAHSMGISRSTVTNHANAIYSKLGISNKVQLAIMCFGHTLQSVIV